MENNKNCVLTRFTALAMALIMVLSLGITPAAAAEENYIAAVGDELFESLQEAADAAEKGETVTLLGDAHGNGVKIPVGKEITFDFGGYTYLIDGLTVGSAGTETLGLQLCKGAKVTLKNGTLKAGEKVKFLVQNYADLTVDNMSLDIRGVEYEYAYALSNNCGNVLLTGGSNISSDYVAFDLWYNLQGGYPEGVSVTFDENYTGTVIGDMEYGAYSGKNTEGWTEKTALVIKSGTFLGSFKRSSAFEEKENITLYGGVFSDEKAADFCAEYHAVVAEGENHRVVPFVTDGEGNAFASVQQAVDAAEGEILIKLNCDLSGDGIFVTGDKKITFDFGGHTYTVDGELVGSATTKSQAMHIEKGAEITLKNGTLKAGGEVRMLLQNYCDLTLDDFNLDTNGKKIYALSNNCGDVLLTGESNITSAAAAFDLWYNLQGGYSEGVSVTFDENYTGTVIGNIEYGAATPTEGWTEKTVLVIKNGSFLGSFVKSSDFTEKAGITLYGGTFADKNAAAYCAEHYKAVAEGDGCKVVPKNYIVASDKGKEYESLQEAVNDAEGETVLTLKTDASGDGIFVTGDKKITFDFGGHTYTVDGELVGSATTKSQAMHIEKGAEITLKNGTLKAGGEVRMLLQNYCDLTLDDFNLDTNGKKIYALSNNCGDVLLTGESNITSAAAAFDLWYNLQGGYSEGVSVTFDENYTGTVIGNIEYGAATPTEGWTEKTVLVIKNGTFTGEFVNTSEKLIYKGDMNITLYGGTFSVPVMDEWCAQGSEAAEFEDGTFGPCFHDFTEKNEDEDHFFGEPDCESGMKYYYDCSKCKQMGSETYSVGQKLGHSFSQYIYNDDATCEKDGTATAVCDREGCNGTETVSVKNTAGHNMGDWTVTKSATCTVKGTEERVCESCGKKETRSFSGGHTYSSTFVTDTEPVCGKKGSKSRHCIYCDAKTDVTSIPAKAHSYKVTVTPATLKKTGKKTTVCTLCSEKTTEDISRIKSVKLSKTSLEYTGKSLKPTVTVKAYNGEKLVKDRDYTVKYSKNKAIGTATVTVTFKGNYSGSKKLTFTIKLAKTESLKLTAKNNAIALSWKTVKGADGYEIQYSTSKKFTKKTTKTTVIKKQSTKKTTLKKLKNKKKYYVKIRAYKTVNGKKVYGSYSSVKNVKTK